MDRADHIVVGTFGGWESVLELKKTQLQYVAFQQFFGRYQVEYFFFEGGIGFYCFPGQADVFAQFAGIDVAGVVLKVRQHGNAVFCLGIRFCQKFPVFQSAFIGRMMVEVLVGEQFL